MFLCAVVVYSGQKMIKYALFLLFPAFSLAQVSIGAGFLSTGTTALKTGLAVNFSAGFESGGMSYGVKYTRAAINEARFNRYQFYIGPQIGGLHLGVTIDRGFARYGTLESRAQGLGIRAAYYYEIRDGVGIVAEVNGSIDGDVGKWVQGTVGAFWRLKQVR